MIQRLILTISGSHYLGCGYFYFYFEHIADYMALLNSSTNFVIYIVFSPHFRRTLVTDVLCRASALKQPLAIVSLRKVKKGSDRERTVRAMVMMRGRNADEARSDRQTTTHREAQLASVNADGEQKWLLSARRTDFTANSCSAGASHATSRQLLQSAEQRPSLSQDVGVKTNSDMDDTRAVESDQSSR